MTIRIVARRRNLTLVQARITKEEIRELELIEYTGNIHLIDTEEKSLAAKEKFQNLLKKYKNTGLDTESRPSFKKTDNFQICLIQVSFEEEKPASCVVLGTSTFSGKE